MNEQTVIDSTVYKVVHGSRAYGTNIEGSDTDEKGIAVMSDPKHYYGFSSRSFEQKDCGWDDGNDRVIYDIRKFFNLALACNPNIIEILYCRPEDVLVSTPDGDKIRAFRDSFLSAKAGHAFGGYAVSQIKRLQNRQKGLMDKKAVRKMFKHAMHLTRLLRMGKEILTDGVVNVWRPDADELIKIRHGLTPVSEILAWAEDAIEELNEAQKNTLLPLLPDYHEAERLMMDIIEDRIERTNELK